MMGCVWLVGQTFSARWLKVVSSQVAPANREDVTRVEAAVIVEGPLPAIEGDQHLNATQRTHGGRADKVGVFTVHSLQLHAHSKAVLLWTGGLLLGNSEVEKGNR